MISCDEQERRLSQTVEPTPMSVSNNAAVCAPVYLDTQVEPASQGTQRWPLELHRADESSKLELHPEPGSAILAQRENKTIGHEAHLGGALAGILVTIAVQPAALSNFSNEVARALGGG